MGEWISVNENLPNEDGRYLCIFEDDCDPIVIICETYMGTGDWDHGDSWYSYDSGKITHWQPLPEPPQ